jgi:3-oxoacyl-(acyl-carrier-protein) synthase
MSTAAEIAAVKGADLGAWLASIGLANVLHAMEEVGAESPHDLMYLEQEDIDSLSLDSAHQSVLLAAIGRIEDIEAGRVTEPSPAPAPAPAPSFSAPAPAPGPAPVPHHEHGHILKLHHEEMERERKKAQAEAEARAALEREIQELKQQMQGAFAQAAAAEQQLKATAESTRRPLDDMSSNTRQLEAPPHSAPPSGGGAAAAARQAAEATADRLAAQLREVQERPAPAAGEAAPAEALAVVGLACRFAGADNIVEFWDNLEAGRDCVTVGPRGRWNVEDFFDPDQDAPGKTYSHWGGFIDDVDMFEPAFFGISARECHSMDPQQRLFLECAWEAMEDAGIVPETLKDDPVGVFLGIQNYDYYRLIGIAGHADEMDAYFGTGNSHSCAVGRLSFILGVKGPSVPVDTACSSSLVATHLAVQSLRSGESNLAFASGVNMMLAPEINVNLCKAHMLSPDGRCHTYSADANGYVRAEGCGVTLLKPLKAALKNNDHIHALVIGSAVNHDGASSGLTVPSGPAQTQVISAAQAAANITPDDVSNIESHGTGTKLGDPIEVTSLCSVFEGRKADKPLFLGTVKTNIGHGESAAGIAGITKAVLSLEKGRIPKHLHMTKL